LVKRAQSLSANGFKAFEYLDHTRTAALRIVNALFQRLANQMAREGKPPGSMSIEEVLARLSD
jgi:hypothetical protein